MDKIHVIFFALAGLFATTYLLGAGRGNLALITIFAGLGLLAALVLMLPGNKK